MKKVVKLTESELVNLVKNVIKEQLAQPAGSSQTFGVPSWTPGLEKADLSCVDAKLFTQKSGDGKTYYAYDLPSAVSGGVAERVVLYSDGTGDIIARGAHNKGRWKCGSNGVEFRADADRQSVRYLGKVQAPAAAAAPAANTANCAASLSEIKEGSIKVLKFGCSTEAVKELQKLLGMETKHQTGYFGNITKAKVIEFQRGNKDDKGQQLKDDGVVGDKTYNAMVKVKTPASNNIITRREREVGGQSEVGRDGVEFPNTTTYKRFN
jgi:peptidoglycan hydrolase-like protein with peptidoglycan-binding domain